MRNTKALLMLNKINKRYAEQHKTGLRPVREGNARDVFVVN